MSLSREFEQGAQSPQVPQGHQVPGGLQGSAGAPPPDAEALAPGQLVGQAAASQPQFEVSTQAAAPVAPELPGGESGEPEIDTRFDEHTFGTFFVGTSEFALPADRVREVVPYPSRVSSVPLCADSVHGIFSLRGEILPIVDAGTVLGVERNQPNEDCKVAVVAHGDGHLGVVFDRTGAVLRAGKDQVKPLEHSDLDDGTVVDGILQLDSNSRIVQLISPQLLGALPGVPAARGLEEDTRGDVTKTYRKAIVVRVGEHELAFPIEDVVEIQEQLEIHPMQCRFEHSLGVVHLRGEVRPIMDFRGVLGLPQAAGSRKLLFLTHEDACIGLGVDALVEALEYASDDLMDLPELPGSEFAALSRGVLSPSGSRHLLLIDVAAYYERYHLAQAARAVSQITEEGPAKVAHEGEDESFFTFRVGPAVLSFALDDVCEVCECPEDVFLSHEGDGDARGMMNLRNTIIPLINIGELSSSSDEGRIVVIIEVDGVRRGLLVDAVESIVRGRASRMSAARLFEKGRAPRGLDSAVLVEGVDGSSTVLAVLTPDRLLSSSDESTSAVAA